MSSEPLPEIKPPLAVGWVAQVLAEELDREQWGLIEPHFIRAVSEGKISPEAGDYDRASFESMRRVLERVAARLWDPREYATTCSRPIGFGVAVPNPEPPPMDRWDLVSAAFQPETTHEVSTEGIRDAIRGRMIWTWKKRLDPEAGGR